MLTVIDESTCRNCMGTIRLYQGDLSRDPYWSHVETGQRYCPGAPLATPGGRLPEGLCPDKDDHKPHRHTSESLGTYWCHADQTKRQPFAGEQMQRKTITRA